MQAPSSFTSVTALVSIKSEVARCIHASDTSAAFTFMPIPITVIVRVPFLTSSASIPQSFFCLNRISFGHFIRTSAASAFDRFFEDRSKPSESSTPSAAASVTRGISSAAISSASQAMLISSAPDVFSHFLPRLPRPLVCRSAINTVPSFNTPFAARRFSSAFVESVSCTVSAFRMLCFFKQFTEPVSPFLSFFIICTVFGRT